MSRKNSTMTRRALGPRASGDVYYYCEWEAALLGRAFHRWYSNGRPRGARETVYQLYCRLGADVPGAQVKTFDVDRFGDVAPEASCAHDMGSAAAFHQAADRFLLKLLAAKSLSTFFLSLATTSDENATNHRTALGSKPNRPKG